MNQKSEYKYYLEQDRLALRITNRKRPPLFGDEVYKYQVLLRKNEYYSLMSGLERLIKLPARAWNKYRFHKLGVRLGFSIAPHSFAEGLSIAHPGCLVVNSKARIGKNCRIQEMVTIGATNGSEKAPKIGDNVYIGSGAKIIGDIEIADDVCIGAGAVVVKSITEPGTTWAGVPARKISNNNSYSNLSPYLGLNEKGRAK